MIHSPHILLPLAAAGLGELIIPLIVLVFWILGGISSARKKQQQRQQESEAGGDDAKMRQQAEVLRQQAEMEIRRRAGQRQKAGERQRPTPRGPRGNERTEAGRITMNERRPTAGRESLQTEWERLQEAIRAGRPDHLPVPQPEPGRRVPQSRQQQSSTAQRATVKQKQKQPTSRNPAVLQPPPVPRAKPIHYSDGPQRPAALSPLDSINPVRPRAQTTDARAIAKWLTPETLRRQFVLTEILQKPVAIRDGHLEY